LAANAPTFKLQTSYKVREKLEDVNTIDQLVELLDKAQNVLVLTGAGIR
jgi:thiamine pyrophosphate-dependent acetolactate synthase large subunit-like protein